jgi:hypothetical protein
MRRQISLELSTLTSQHDILIKKTSDGEKHEVLTDVLDGRNIQTKKEVVMQGRNLHKVTRKKISSHDSHVHHTPDGGGGHRHRHDDDAMNMEESGVEISRSKPLSELTIGEVGRLLESIDFDEYKAVFVRNKIDGKCLMQCNTVKDVVNMGVKVFVKASLLLNEIRKWKTTSQDDDLYGKLVKPLSELSVHEVGIVVEALTLGKYKETLLSNQIDGECLMKCNTVEDVVNMGINIFVKAHVFLDKVMIWKASGVPMEYFSVDQTTDREVNDAEDMIAVMKVDNLDYRKTNDDDVSVAAFVDSEVRQGEAGTNNNDHEDSVVDDTSIIEPIQLIELSSAEDMKELTAKTSILLDEITKWKASEISMEYFSANHSS